MMFTGAAVFRRSVGEASATEGMQGRSAMDLAAHYPAAAFPGARSAALQDSRTLRSRGKDRLKRHLQGLPERRGECANEFLATDMTACQLPHPDATATLRGLTTQISGRSRRLQQH